MGLYDGSLGGATGDVSGAWATLCTGQCCCYTEGSATSPKVLISRLVERQRTVMWRALTLVHTLRQLFPPAPHHTEEKRGADARHGSGKQQTTTRYWAGEEGEKRCAWEEEKERKERERGREQEARERERGANSQSQGQFPWVVSGQPSVWLSRCLKWQWLDLYFPPETQIRSISQRGGVKEGGEGWVRRAQKRKGWSEEETTEERGR